MDSDRLIVLSLSSSLLNFICLQHDTSLSQGAENHVVEYFENIDNYCSVDYNVSVGTDAIC